MLVKAQQTVERAALAGLAVQQVALRGSYGSAPSAEEVQEAGNQCPICQVRAARCGGKGCTARWCHCSPGCCSAAAAHDACFTAAAPLHLIPPL